MGHEFKATIAPSPEYFSRYCMCDDKLESGNELHEITITLNNNRSGQLITLCTDCMREFAKMINEKLEGKQ